MIGRKAQAMGKDVGERREGDKDTEGKQTTKTEFEVWDAKEIIFRSISQGSPEYEKMVSRTSLSVCMYVRMAACTLQ